MNGDAYYCIATDANGQRIVSEQVILTVQSRVVPQTGDSPNSYALAAVAVVCVVLFAALLRNGRKHEPFVS